MKQVAFTALIKNRKDKSLECGEKETDIVLRFRSTDKLEELNILNELQVADGRVMVGITECPLEKLGEADKMK